MCGCAIAAWLPCSRLRCSEIRGRRLRRAAPEEAHDQPAERQQPEPIVQLPGPGVLGLLLEFPGQITLTDRHLQRHRLHALGALHGYQERCVGPFWRGQSMHASARQDATVAGIHRFIGRMELRPH